MEKWRFFRSGGFDQARLDEGEEIAMIGKLDQKLWVALSCPTSGIFFDAETLKCLDSDGDGHIRAKEVIDAVNWACSELSDPAWLAKSADSLPLDAFRQDSSLLAGARHILKSIGRENSVAIALEDCAALRENFEAMPFNGDGLISAEAGRNAEEIRLIGEIADCSGSPGSISRPMSDRFFAAISAYSAWLDSADPAVMPLGEDTFLAAECFLKVKDKIEDYFRRCRIAAFDPRAGQLINRPEADFVALSGLDLSHADEAISALPLATAAAGRPLPLGQGLNPLWAGSMAQFGSRVVVPVLGEIGSLDEADWSKLCGLFAPHQRWMAAKPDVPVEKLGRARIAEIAASDGKAGIDALIDHDLALEPEMKAIDSVEKLLRYARDLSAFVNNFASFRDFYTRRGKAMFQAGTLYLDGRSCELCIAVEDVAKHAVLATLSRICLVYCELRRGSRKMSIAAAFTSGDSDQLMVGRNGVFYDREGLDWDATVVRIIDHPISLRQAFMSPYKTIGRLVGEQLQKLAASRSKAIQESAAKNIIESGQAVEKPPFDAGKFAGIFAAIGLAVGAIGTALDSVVTGFLGLKLWQIPVALACLALAISGPSMLIAWMKLRQRNLGPLLDANGWAINSRAKINLPFGASLTSVAKLPEGAQRALSDPYAEKKRPWIWIVIPALLLLALIAYFRR